LNDFFTENSIVAETFRGIGCAFVVVGKILMSKEEGSY
jgi:hypothetical protein